jgi:hypothetical protein
MSITQIIFREGSSLVQMTDSTLKLSKISEQEFLVTSEGRYIELDRLVAVNGVQLDTGLLMPAFR